jgi:hypothetical protein
MFVNPGKYIWLFLIVLFCAVLTAFVYWRYLENTRIRLPHGYVWRLHAPNEMVIVDPQNNIIIGPGYLEIRADYPYIYGFGNSQFILNLANGDLEFFDSWEGFQIRLDALGFSVTQNRHMANLYDFLFPEGNKTRAEEFLRAVRPK